MKLREKKGFSLVETLVVLAIILILMALYLPTLAKAMRKAKEVAGKEALRQSAIGKFADVANSTRPGDSRPGRDEARDAFRQSLDIGKGDSMIVSELLYVVRSDDEFRAYYHTLLNPDNNEPLTYSDGGSLNAYDEFGALHVLERTEVLDYRGATYVMAWEFISTNLGETSSGTLGGTVLYSDGHTNYVRYPDEFPMTRTVAELSHAFVAG
ncbi:MAG: type II secretion system protein [Candidatus Hydrogenedentes bacterium]|nr:type II secretion system protein [Candidatus Hydrogenedentota bacterium]